MNQQDRDFIQRMCGLVASEMKFRDQVANMPVAEGDRATSALAALISGAQRSPKLEGIDDAEFLRELARAALTAAQQIDGLVPYLVEHDHRHGTSKCLRWGPKEQPTRLQLIGVLEESFEPAAGEFLSASSDFTIEDMTGLSGTIPRPNELGAYVAEITNVFESVIRDARHEDVQKGLDELVCDAAQEASLDALNAEREERGREAIIEAGEELASQINNEGPHSQIEFLISQGVVEPLDELLTVE